MVKVNINEEIRRAAESGKVVLGTDRSLKLLRAGKVKMVIVASNCPDKVKREVEYLSKLFGVPLFRYPGSSVELGTAVGRPFSVNVCSVLDPGNSSILSTVVG
ncbi:MAG: 50S ribosomal protein L30e [Hadesarchaea archaeon]|nr:MAG: 50S ribosomal protein L30e [Hadesarchaea archaeon]TDA34524.1 MAG: 50S ribosomal protein L30e [Hadesarchaea archaeon]